MSFASPSRQLLCVCNCKCIEKMVLYFIIRQHLSTIHTPRSLFLLPFLSHLYWCTNYNEAFVSMTILRALWALSPCLPVLSAYIEMGKWDVVKCAYAKCYSQNDIYSNKGKERECDALRSVLFHSCIVHSGRCARCMIEFLLLYGSLLVAQHHHILVPFLAILWKCN